MARHSPVSTEDVLRIVHPGHALSSELYVVVWESYYANLEHKPVAVFTLEEWRAKPVEKRRLHRTSVYRAKDQLDAYVEAMKEQTDA